MNTKKYNNILFLLFFFPQISAQTQQKYNILFCFEDGTIFNDIPGDVNDKNSPVFKRIYDGDVTFANIDLSRWEALKKYAQLENGYIFEANDTNSSYPVYYSIIHPSGYDEFEVMVFF